MKRLKRFFGCLSVSLISVAVCAFLLTRCGLPACLGGVGVNGQQDCSGGSTPVTTQGSGAFTLAMSPTAAVVGQTSQAAATGGKSGPYTYTIDPSSNPGAESPLAGSINPSTGLYQAPYSIAPNTSETITIRATDTTSAYKTVTITVTSG